MKKTETKTEAVRLPGFGIPALLPYLRPYRALLLVMVVCGLAGSAADLAIPFFQRYALDHFI